VRSLRIGFEYGARLDGLAATDPNVGEFVNAGRQGLLENVGLAQTGSEIKPMTGSHQGCRLRRE